MRAIVLHNRAKKNLRKMPQDRQIQISNALKEVANLEDISTYPNIKSLTGNYSGWFRLRTGGYRSILQLRLSENGDFLYVDFIGTRGDAY